ncbi:MAG: lysylphosphatidylglycerol synthase transmembrane domain-containing protein [Myxococcota bacterium]|nr:lysylphosphatidylglycerol synthase transmembrane domain-containing protein [Myxococcota bacterium]
MRERLQLLFGLLLGITGMWWATKGVHWEVVESYVKNIKPFYVILLAVLFMVQQLLRAYRQQLLLPKIRYRSSLMVLCIGFFFINTLPVRMGEITRPLLLKSKEEIPLSASFAMVFTERILDLISAFFMALLVLSYAQIPMIEENWLARIPQLARWFIPLLIFVLFVLFFAGGWLEARLPMFLRTRLNPFFATLRMQRKSIVKILLLTVLIWGGTPLMFLSGAMALGGDLSYIQGFGILGFTMLGMAAPNAPGFVGTYEAAFVSGLSIFGFSDANFNIAFAFLFHSWVYIVQSTSALYFLYTDRISFRNILKQLRHFRVNSSA